MNTQKLLIVLFTGLFFTISVKSSAQEVFTLYWSEYPSWSAFDAVPRSFIDGREGKQGAIETQYGIDLKLVEADYDTCLTAYASEQADFVCITNMDALNPSLSVDSVAILPTSRSHGADALIVTDAIGSLADLRGQQVYGLSATVSDYAFYRFVQLHDEDKSHFHTFSNMDPGAAAINMQQGDDRFQAIVVWNPFVINTLAARDDVRVLHDSSEIPNEIIDMVVVNKKVLSTDSGRQAALAVVESFYEANRLLNDPETHEDTLIAIGEKFSNLGVDSMKKVIEQTLFYSTPEEALALFQSKELKNTMNRVVDFCFEQAIVEDKPSIAYSQNEEANLVFDSSFVEAAANN